MGGGNASIEGAYSRASSRRIRLDASLFGLPPTRPGSACVRPLRRARADGATEEHHRELVGFPRRGQRGSSSRPGLRGSATEWKKRIITWTLDGSASVKRRGRQSGAVNASAGYPLAVEIRVSLKNTAKVFLVIGIVGIFLIIADLVLVILDPSMPGPYVTIVAGVCIAIAGFVGRRALAKSGPQE